MLKILLNAITMVATSSLLMAGNIAYSASFTVNTSDAYPPAAPAEWNPRAEDGLFATMSKSIDYFNTISYTGGGGGTITVTTEGTAAAATYGSDTSGGDGILDPRLQGYAIEPMADTMANVHRLCTVNGGPYYCSGYVTTWASASASVNHRIVQRGIPDISPELQGILDTLGTVHVRLDYSLSATATNPDGPYASLATAAFSVMQGNAALISRKACASSTTSSGCTSVGEESSTWESVLDRSTVDNEVIYTINAGAGALASTIWASSDGQFFEAQAVADPFLYLDPTWEYAPYFMVQQESLLQPGEWVEVTRIWAQPIPEPETYAMMLVGLGLVITVVRRRKQA